jgi:Tfp pilus assembly protein PilX
MINPADPASTTTPPAPLLPGRNTTSDSATNDTLFIPYGSDNGQPEGNPVLGVNGSNYVVQSPSAFAVNDWVVATPATCPGTVTLARVTAVDQATASVTVNTVLASATALHNLGQAPRFVGYMVRDGALQTCDFMAANGTTDCRTFNATNWTSLSTNMPVLRAQYGRDSNAGSMDGAMDVWDQTPDATLSNTCRWARINAVRFAVVARSSSYESRIDPGTGLRSCEQVTQTARTWARVRDRGAVAQRHLDGQPGRIMLNRRSSSFRRARRASQQGMVLVMALIVLVLVTLAGLSMMRSVDTTTLVAGNLAFQQAATRASDLGIERAVGVLQTLAAGGQLNTSDATNSYFATMRTTDSPDPTVPGRRDWPTLWENAIKDNVAPAVNDTTTGNSVQFAIHRLCANASPPNAGGNCVTAPGQITSAGSSEDSNELQVQGSQTRVYYRITVRVIGPRRTESYVQAHVAM